MPTSPSSATRLTTAELTSTDSSESLLTETVTITAGPAYSPGVCGVTVIVVIESTETTTPVDSVMGSSRSPSTSGSGGATVGPSSAGSAGGDHVEVGVSADGSGVTTGDVDGCAAGGVEPCGSPLFGTFEAVHADNASATTEAPTTAMKTPQTRRTEARTIFSPRCRDGSDTEDTLGPCPLRAQGAGLTSEKAPWLVGRAPLSASTTLPLHSGRCRPVRCKASRPDRANATLKPVASGTLDANPSQQTRGTVEWVDRSRS